MLNCEITEYIPLASLDDNAYKAAIARAASQLKSGQLVAFPTETVYGLGADGLNAEACRAIYAAKGRPSDNPLILHVADRAGIEQIAQQITPTAEKIIAAFMPGPVTIILRRASCVPAAVTGGLDTVAIRMPDHAVARDLITALGRPIAAPSANRSGRPSPTDAAAVRTDLDGRIAAILDGGTTNIGLESTIIDCTEQDFNENFSSAIKKGEAEKSARPVVTILRPGAITAEMLLNIGLSIAAAPNEIIVPAKDAVPLAPGLKYTHYAPLAPLTLCRTAETLLNEYARRTADGETVGLIVSTETASQIKNAPYIYPLAPQADITAIAARLYNALRYFDDKPVSSLLAETVAEKDLGQAVMNRLRKASGGRII